jgi:hypothetical protein
MLSAVDGEVRPFAARVPVARNGDFLVRYPNQEPVAFRCGPRPANAHEVLVGPRGGDG